ncbi:MAG: ArnT family glycosyltransferase [Anaerolineae bacterium]
MDAVEVPLRGLRAPAVLPRPRSRALARWAALAFLSVALFVAGWLRWPVLAVNPFHEDEALYSTWALRIADGSDPWLEGVLVDKPPLLPYAVAALFRALGPSEPVARLPGFLAGLGSVVCLYGAARSLYGRTAAFLAAWFLALSPLHISLSGTAFTDPLLVFWGLAAAWAAAAGRPLWAGLALGLAASTKQHGWLFIPLVLALLALGRGRKVETGPPEHLRRLRGFGRAFLACSLAFALPTGLTTWWDAHRWSFRPSYLDCSLTAYGGLHLAGWEALPGRAAAWAQLAGYLGAWPPCNLLLAAARGLVLTLALRQVRAAGREAGREAWSDLLWIAFGLGYLGVHVALNFQLWDRYLLPLAPVASLLGARALVLLGRWLRHATGPRKPLAWGMVVLAAVGLWWRPATMAAQSRLPLGADHGAYDGMRAAALWLREHVGPGEPVYHRWLGWHLGYYLYGTLVDHRWYPQAEVLADLVSRSQGGYLAAPSWHSLAAERVALAKAGFRLEPVLRAWGRVPSCTITVYRLRPGPPDALAPPGGPIW